MSWGKGCSSRLAALAAELRRALRSASASAPRAVSGEAVHFLPAAEMAALAAPQRRQRRRRRHLRGPGAWRLRLRLARNGQRQEEEAKAPGSPSARAPQPHRPPLPGARQALLAARRRLTAASQGRRFPVPAARRAPRSWRGRRR